jgi:hypothetical protein
MGRKKTFKTSEKKTVGMKGDRVYRRKVMGTSSLKKDAMGNRGQSPFYSEERIFGLENVPSRQQILTTGVEMILPSQ